MSLEQELEHLAARRWRVALTLTALVLVSYFGFILLVAFAKPLMGTLVWGGRISVGILLGASVIVISAALTGVYVRWANNHYDATAADLHARHKTRAEDAAVAARAAQPSPGLATGPNLPALSSPTTRASEVHS
jgi:uncharacterized membrane protein (DUF485 family)